MFWRRLRLSWRKRNAEASVGTAAKSVEESRVSAERLEPVADVGGILACCTQIGPKDENQDRYKCGTIGPWKTLVIADGVTRSLHGEQAAEIAVGIFYETLEQAHNAGQELGTALFREAYERVAERLRSTGETSPAEGGGSETTLIGVVESDDRFFVTYLGDGRVYLVRGDLQKGVQLMITHGVGSALGGALGSYGLLGQPVYVEHSKSINSGEVFVTVTDGAFYIELGENEPPTITQILGRLGDSKEMLSSSEALEEGLGRFLQDLDDRGLLVDNATLGIIITERAKEGLVTEEQVL